MSFAAWMPSSFRFFSICLLRASAARSSADEVHPMVRATSIQNVTPAMIPSFSDLLNTDSLCAQHNNDTDDTTCPRNTPPTNTTASSSLYITHTLEL